MASMAAIYITGDFNSISRTQQMQALMLHLYRERYNFNKQLLCRPFIFQSHVGGGGGGNKDLPEISRLDQVELQFGGKRDCCRKAERTFRMSRVNYAMNFVYLSLRILAA